MPEAPCITGDVSRATFFEADNRYVFPRVDVSKIELYTDENGEVSARGFSKFEAFQYFHFQHHLMHKQGRRAGEKIPTPFFLRQVNYLYENCEKYESIIWVCPRGFGKSILNFFIVLYYAIAEKKFNEILLIGANQTLAEGWLNKIKTEITDNESIRAEYGDLCSETDKDGKWANDEIKIRNGIRIFARGAGSNMRGLHPGLIVLDDIENDEQAQSAMQVDKMEEWIRGTVINMQNQDDSVIIWTGTFLERDSVLQKAFNGDGWDDSWFRIKHEAYVTEETVDWQNKNSTWCPYQLGEPIWPEKYPREWLEKRQRKIGIAKFLAEFMNDPRAKDLQVFPKDYIRYYDPEELPKIIKSFVIIDPAAKTKEINCESGIVVFGTDGGRTPSPDIFVLDFEAGRWDETNLIRRAINYALKWKSDYIGIEEVNFSTYLLNAVEMEMAQRHLYIPVQPKKPRSKDKVTRAKTVRPLMERGHVKFLKTQTELIEQLTNFPRKGVLKDLVDAYVYGLLDLMTHWEDVDALNDKAKKKERGEVEPVNTYAFEEIAY